MNEQQLAPKDRLQFRLKSQNEIEFPDNENVEDEDDQKENGEIESVVFDYLQDNYEDYLKEVEQQKVLSQNKTDKIRNKLIPADRIRFDNDEEFARQTIVTATTRKNNEEEQDSLTEEEPEEPERNFDKLRARIKLKALKKYREDEILLQKEEEK